LAPINASWLIGKDESNQNNENEEIDDEFHDDTLPFFLNLPLSLYDIEQEKTRIFESLNETEQSTPDRNHVDFSPSDIITFLSVNQMVRDLSLCLILTRY
jgi:hypothetical protein